MLNDSQEDRRVCEEPFCCASESREKYLCDMPHKKNQRSAEKHAVTDFTKPLGRRISKKKKKTLLTKKRRADTGFIANKFWLFRGSAFIFHQAQAVKSCSALGIA